MCYRQTAVVAILLLACAPDQPRPGSPTRESHRAGGVTELYGRPTSAAAMPFTSARRRPSGHRDPRWGGETEARGSGLSKTHHTPPPMTNVVAASEGTPHHLNVLLMAAQSQCTGKVRHRGGGGTGEQQRTGSLGPTQNMGNVLHMSTHGFKRWVALGSARPGCGRGTASCRRWCHTLHCTHSSLGSPSAIRWCCLSRPTSTTSPTGTTTTPASTTLHVECACLHARVCVFARACLCTHQMTVLPLKRALVLFCMQTTSGPPSGGGLPAKGWAPPRCTRLSSTAGWRRTTAHR